MKRTTMAGLVAAVTLTAAIPVSAQQYRFDVGINGGYAYFTKSLTEGDHDVAEDVGFNDGWITGLQATGWLNDNWGVRLDFGYTEKVMRQGDDEGHDLEDINLWDFAASAVYRFNAPAVGEFLGLETMPYVSAGIGAKNINVWGEDEYNRMSIVNGSGTPGSEPNDEIFVRSKTNLEGRLALGADWRFMKNLIVRTELGDIMFDSPTYANAGDDEDIGKVVHELYGTVGLAVPFGFIIPPPVAVAPPPPPPAPAPAPKPREENVSVCVIDPTSANGVSNVNAIYMVDQGDTLVVRNGQRVAIGSAYGNVAVAPDQNWYVAGQPLVFNIGNRRTEFVSYGGARVIPANSLALLGYQNGIAVYADADDVADVQNQWNDMRRAQAQGNISEALAQRQELADEFREIEFLYVPMQPVGCVFQALQRVEQVQKGASQ